MLTILPSRKNFVSGCKFSAALRHTDCAGGVGWCKTVTCGQSVPRDREVCKHQNR